MVEIKTCHNCSQVGPHNLMKRKDGETAKSRCCKCGYPPGGAPGSAKAILNREIMEKIARKVRGGF